MPVFGIDKKTVRIGRPWRYSVHLYHETNDTSDNHPFQSVIPCNFPVNVAFRVNGGLMHVGLCNMVL